MWSGWCPQRGTHTTHACTHPCSSASRTTRVHTHACVPVRVHTCRRTRAHTQKAGGSGAEGEVTWPQPGGCRTAGGGKGQGGPPTPCGPRPVPLWLQPGASTAGGWVRCRVHSLLWGARVLRAPMWRALSPRPYVPECQEPSRTCTLCPCPAGGSFPGAAPVAACASSLGPHGCHARCWA